LPQAPQLLALFCSSTQAVPQSEKPPRQEEAQTPTTQAWPLGQALAQAPQFALLLSRSTQVPAQSVNLPQPPASGAPLEPLLELPLLLLAVPLVLVLPLLLTPLLLPPLLELPPLEEDPPLHEPNLQVCPLVHALPHVPQFELSVSGLMHLPEQETLEPGQPPEPLLPPS
jgi:hypothetical protein